MVDVKSERPVTRFPLSTLDEALALAEHLASVAGAEVVEARVGALCEACGRREAGLVIMPGAFNACRECLEAAELYGLVTRGGA